MREDGYGCGRVRYDTGPNNTKFWSWFINPPVPVQGKRTGRADTLDEAKVQFKEAWAVARASLTSEDVAQWHELEDGVTERFAR